MLDSQTCLPQQTALVGESCCCPLANLDLSKPLRFSDQLYGRDLQADKLRSLFETGSLRSGQPSPCTPQMVVVTGAAGDGKSTVVRNSYQDIHQYGGRFVMGKYEQYRRNVPYCGIAQACQTLIQQYLAGAAPERERVRSQLLDALGDLGQIVIDVVPALGQLIGPQTAALPLPAIEAQHRFDLVFQKFIQVLAHPQTPVVMFLDDLQWADGASLHLLQRCLLDCPGLLLIGAYRDQEVAANIPLQHLLNELETARALIPIPLPPLQAQHVSQLLADTLNHTIADTQALANLVQRKTGGNPFFIQEFLRSLHAGGLLRFNWTARQWNWQETQIAAHALPDTIVELMVHKISDYSLAEQQVLQHAACIGHQFELHTLALLEQQSLETIATQLARALRDGLIVVLDDSQLFAQTSAKPPIHNTYQFSHDRIAQAAYSLNAIAERPALHWQLGQLLFQQAPPDLAGTELFNVLNHFNLGQALIQQAPERLALARMNLQAGQQAQAMVAYEPAYRYFQAGIEWLSSHRSWLEQYDLCLALYTGAVETAYLTGNFHAMDQWVEIVLQNAQTLLDTIKIYELQILAHQAKNQLLEAIQLARLVLAKLGVTFPERPGKWHVGWRLVRTQLRLWGQQPDDLVRLSPMADRHQLAVMRILSIAGSVAYLTAPQLLPFLICKQIQLSLTYGNAPESTYAYAAYGLMLCGVRADYEAGYRFGQLSLQLARQGPSQRFQARTLLVFEGFVHHWHEDATHTLAPLRRTHQLALQAGDLEYAGYAAHLHGLHAFFLGQALGPLEAQMADYNAAIATLGQTTSFQQNAIYQQAVQCLLGRSATPQRLQGEVYCLDHMQAVHAAANDHAALHGAHLNQGILSYLFYDYAQAEQHFALAHRHVTGALASLASSQLCFYSALGSLAAYGQKALSEKRRMRNRVHKHRQRLYTWAQQTPSNFLGKYHLVEAEWHRALGNPWSAIQHYDQAIQWAITHDCPNDLGLAYELAAKFYLAEGQILNAQGHLREARQAYQRWGARAKVQHLEQTYAEILGGPAGQTGGQRPPTPTPLPTGPDMPAVFEAAQALVHEIVPERLLCQLITTLLEQTKAQKGFVLLQREHQWVVEAAATIDQGPSAMLQSIPLDTLIADPDRPLLATTIVNTVISTQTDVVLMNARQNKQFNLDPYIQITRPKSIFCAPLRHHGLLVGVVYLENNHTAGAFNSDRLDILRLLLGQAAVALTNAYLYQQLETLLQELRHEIEGRTLTEQELRDSEQRLSQFLEAVPVGVLVIDDTGHLYYVNQTATHLLGQDSHPGQSLEELLAQRPAYVVGTQRPYPWDKRGLVQALQGKTVSIDNVEVQHGETVIPLEMLATPITDMEGKVTYAIAVLQDITQRRKAEAEHLEFVKTTTLLQQNNVKLERLASYDALTQVANRRRFDEYLDVEWERLQQEGLSLALIMCDVDYFKYFNDRYGHQAGDTCLTQVAQALTRAVKRPADLVARYGGEEFAIILPTSDTLGAQKVAKQIQSEIWALKIEHALSEVHEHVTVSLGIAATIPSNQQSAANLIMAADLALYEAKKQGRNRFYSF